MTEAQLRARYVGRFHAFLAEGIHEVPDHSNKQRLGAHYQWNGVAWCAITCSEAFWEEFGFYLFKTASVYQLIQWAKAGTYGLRWIPREHVGEAQPADLFTYDSQLGAAGAGNPEHFHVNCLTVKGSLANGPIGAGKACGGNESDAVREQPRDGKYLQGAVVLPWAEIAKRLGDEQPQPQPGGFPMALTDKEQRDLADRIAQLSNWMQVDSIDIGTTRTSINVGPSGLVRVVNTGPDVTIHGYWVRLDGTTESESSPGSFTVKRLQDFAVPPFVEGQSPIVAAIYWLDKGKVRATSWAKT